MGNEVQVQQAVKGASFPVPAHIAARLAARGEGNLAPRFAGGNELLIGGKGWVAKINGEKKLFDRPVIVKIDGQYVEDPTGRREKRQEIDVVIIDQSVRGRELRAPYNPLVPSGPLCWSQDGRAPHPSVEEKEYTTCELCPKNPKSPLGAARIEKDQTADICKGMKFLAVLLVGDDGKVAHDFPALRLKLAPTSLYDTRDKVAIGEEWFAWDNYIKFLVANMPPGASTGDLITTMRFSSSEMPQIQFHRGKWLEQADSDKVLARSKTDEVKKILNGYAAFERAQGKPLPKDDEPKPLAPDPVAAAQKLRAAEEAEAARHAEAAAEAKEMAEAKAEKKRKVDEAKAALAALEAEEGGFDDGPSKAEVAAGWEQHDKEQIARRASDQVAAGIAEEKKRTRRSKAEMEAVRSAEAAAKATIAPPMETPVEPPVAVSQMNPVTTTSLGGPAEIPAALAAALPAWD